jgi:histidine ammonia-lyase
MERLRASQARLNALSRDAEAHYGINTGFGPLCTVKIAANDLEKLQENLILSHAMGFGPPAADAIVRLMLAIKVNSLLKGFSGVSPELVERLLRFLNDDLLPIVPEQGSVGSSGDLAPLSHIGLALLGRGRVRLRGEEMDARAALDRVGLAPYRFRPKEALALINGTQFMSACGAFAVARGRQLAKTADVVLTMSLEALRGSIRPFDARIAEARPHPGHGAVSENVRRMMEGSEILASHAKCGKVQDPYSLRCAPQIHGACRDALDHAARTLEIEINAATDNPLILEDGSAISGGNFHGEPLALVLDYAAMALAELANVSERRGYLLLEGRDGLPKLLLKETGVNSGYMIAQYAAAALVSENKVLCHPSSVDSVPTSLGQEDLNSMGAIGGAKALRVLANAETVLAIEATMAAQGLDFRKPLRAGPGPEAAWGRMRLDIDHATEDRLFRDDIDRALELLRAGELAGAAEGAVGGPLR